MKTVHEVSALAGVSVRTLQYYDKIGLLKPTSRTEAGYRQYSDADLRRLQQILLFRELEFPLADIKRIVGSPDFDQKRALDQQLELLKLKREHIEKLIDMATAMRNREVPEMDFEAFDTSKMDEYAKQAKASWGETSAWKEYERKSAGRSKGEEMDRGKELMQLFVPFGAMAAKGEDPASEAALQQAAAIQAFITDHFYTCTDEIFASLGMAYGAGGDFTQNINAVAGEGAAEFASKSVELYCNSK